MKKILPGVHGVIAGTEPFTSSLFNYSNDLKIISRVGIGLDSIDLNAAKKHNIMVCTTRNSPTQAVAEHTITLILSIVKQIPSHIIGINPDPLKSILLKGRTVGIIGLGRIGFQVANILERFGCNIAFYDPYYGKKIEVNNWTRYFFINELVKNSNIITLHCPPLKDGQPLITKNILSYCNKGIIIINTARGSLIDESALIEYLNKGIIHGVGLDVTKEEPYNGPLTNYSQVLITPHIASNTIESREEMEKESVDNILSYLC